MSQLLINVGAVPNDGTGDTVRAGHQKSNSNFTELYNRVGPCLGSKYEQFRAAILGPFVVQSFVYGELFYISEIKAHVLSGGLYHYSIKIAKTASYTATGTVYLEQTEFTSATPLTTKINYNMKAPVGLGISFFGAIGIDWSKLTTGTYTCANFIEGGLYCPVIPTQNSQPTGGGNIDTIGNMISRTEITDNDVIDGTYSWYIGNTAGLSVSFPTIELIKGEVTIKNFSAGELEVNSAPAGDYPAALLDGEYTMVLIPAKGSITINLIKSGTSYVLAIKGAYNLP